MEWRFHDNDAMSIFKWSQLLDQKNALAFYKHHGQEAPQEPELPLDCFMLIIQNKFNREMIKAYPNIMFFDATHHVDK
jgi:hypothetical protein